MTTERDPVRAALADEIARANLVTMHHWNAQMGWDDETELTSEDQDVIVAALNAPLPGRLDCGGALKSLSNEISGWLSAYEPDLRAAMGNTNFAVMEHKLAEANVALLKTDVEYHRGYAAGVADQIETQEYERNIAEAPPPTLDCGEPSLNQEAAETQYAPNPRDVFAVPFPQAEDDPIAWTNKAQLGFLKDPTCVDIPMAMWARASTMSPIPLYALPPLNSGAEPGSEDWFSEHRPTGMDVGLGARAIAASHGHDPDDMAPRTVMCTAENEPVAWWKVFEEQAEACIAALPRAVDGGAAGEREAAIHDALLGLIEAVELDSDTGGKGISGYTAARLHDARETLSAFPRSERLSPTEITTHKQEN